MINLQFITDNIDRKQLSYFFILCIIIGLFTSDYFRALPSIGIGGLFLSAIKPLSFRQQWKTFISQKSFLVLSLIPLLHLLYFFSTESQNMDYYWHRMALRLPFFLLPFSMAILPPINKRTYLSFFYIFFIILSITAITSTINYCLHFEEINSSYLNSKILPVIVNHVRYSLMISFGIFCGLFLYMKNYYFKYKAERYIILFLTIFLFIFLHLLSVRSGLGTFYIALFVSIIFYIKKKKRYLLGLIVISMAALVPIVSYFTLEPFKNKVENTFNDVTNLRSEYSANFHSLTGRLYSYEVGWQLFKTSPLFGVGPGNLKQKTDIQYIKSYLSIKPQKRLLPHNQYLHNLVSLGSVGFVLFYGVFYFSFFYKKNWKKDSFLLIHYLIISLSFMVEGTLETQLGTNYCILFMSLPLYYLHSQYIFKGSEATEDTIFSRTDKATLAKNAYT